MSYQPKTGAACACKPGAQRDNCPACEGTGQVINFAAIHARKTSKHGTPDWADDARFYFQFAADNDRNGNPRRVFGFYDERANLIGAVDEDYSGLPAWARERTRNGTLFDGGRIPVPASFRRELLAP